MPTSATFDLAEGPDGDILTMSRLVSGIDLTMQRVRRRVDRFLGDWILDAAVGLPYFEWSQQKPPQTQAIGARIRAEIEGTTGVSGVTGWTSTLDRATRLLSFSGTIHTTDGDASVTVTPFGAPGTGNRAPQLRIVAARGTIAHG